MEDKTPKNQDDELKSESIKELLNEFNVYVKYLNDKKEKEYYRKKKNN